MPNYERRGDTPARRRLAAVREQMAEFMARVLPEATRSYCALAALCPGPSAVSEQSLKEFTAYHSACRSALSHIDRLIRVQQWAVASNDGRVDDLDIQALLSRARSTLEEYPAEDE